MEGGAANEQLVDDARPRRARGDLTFDLPAARYAPRMARFRAEAIHDDVPEDLLSDAVLVLAEMVAQAVDAQLEAHQRIEVRLSWEPGSACVEVCYPAKQPDAEPGSNLRDLIVSNIADAHDLSWCAGRVRRSVELHRGAGADRLAGVRGEEATEATEATEPTEATDGADGAERGRTDP